MAIVTAAVTVGTAPTSLAVGGSGLSSQTVITIKPEVAAEGALVFVGDSSVAVSDGLPLDGGISFDLQPGEEIYGIVASGTVVVRVLEHG